MLFHPQAWFLLQAGRTSLYPWGHPPTFLYGRRSEESWQSVHPHPVEDEAGRWPEASPELFSQLTFLVLGIPLSGTFHMLLLAPSGRAGREGQWRRGLHVSLAAGRVLAMPGESLRPYCARGYEVLVALKAFLLLPSSQGALKKDGRLVAQTEGEGWGWGVDKVYSSQCQGSQTCLFFPTFSSSFALSLLFHPDWSDLCWSLPGAS